MTKLYPYQKEGVRKIREFGGRTLLADQMGLGKSLQILSYMVEESLFPAVVVCPASLKWNWQNEARIHCDLRAEVLMGRTPPTRKRKTLPPLVVINYDVLEYWVGWLKGLNPKLLVLDECHYCSNYKSRRTKASRELSREIPHVVALSGTPLTNRPIELWPVLNMLRPDLWGSWFKFGQRYCGPKQTYWGVQFKGATNLKELNQTLKDNVMIRRRKEDVLSQLPEKVRCVVPLELDKASKKEYKEASDNFLRWLAGQKPHALKRSMKAEAISRITHLKGLLGDLKREPVKQWVSEHLDSTDSKLICFGVHKIMVRYLEGEFGGLSVRVDGSVKGEHRQLAFDRFQRDDRVRLLVGNIKAAGVGWNGTAAGSVAFAEFGWTPGEHTQSEDRAHRLGQTRGVVCYYLTAMGTIEESFCRLIHKKQRVLSKTLDGKGRGSDVDLMDELIAELRG